MCLGVIRSATKPKTGYKIVESTEDKNKFSTPYQYKLLTLGEWFFIENVQTGNIPSFIKYKSRYTTKPYYIDEIYQRYSHLNSKYEEYIYGFHLLSKLVDARTYLEDLSYQSGRVIIKCEYLGILATGYDFTSTEILDKKINTIVAMAIRPLSIVK